MYRDRIDIQLITVVINGSGLLVSTSLYPETGYKEVQDSKIKVPRSITLNLKYKPGGYTFLYRKVKPIDHSKLTIDEKLSIVSSFSHPLKYELVPKLEALLSNYKSLYFQICRMVSVLEFWERFTPGTKIVSAYDAFKKCILGGYKYAEDIKKIYQEGMRRTLNDSLTKSFEYDKVEYTIDSYNSIPPYWYFVLWEEPIEDYKYMLEKAKVDDEALSEFESVLDRMCPSTINSVNDSDLLNISSSTSRVWDGKRVKMNINMLSQKDITFSTNCIRGYRTIIPVSPANWRDAITLDLSSYFTMRKVDLLTLELLDKFETSHTAKTARTSSRRFRRMHKYQTVPLHGLYIMRDIKKSGLTMPIKQIGPILRKVLCKRYPKLGFELIEALENLILIIEGKDETKRLEVLRGLGLGMGNNLWTLIQCVAFEMLRERISTSIDGLFGNDDSIIHVPMNDGEDHDSLVFNVIDEDQRICESLGIILSLNKTFTAPSYVFYEEYSDVRFRDKESKIISNLGALRVASCIYEAKMLTKQMTSYTSIPDIRSLATLQEHWGYEFFPEESYLDFRLGGWIDRRQNGLNQCLLDIYENRLHGKKLRGAIAASAVSLNTKFDEPLMDLFDTDRPYGKKYGIKLLKFIPKKNREGVEHLLYNRKELIKYYTKVNNISNDFSIDFKRMSEIRLRVYKRNARCTSKVSLSEAIKKLYNDLAIPDEEVRRTTRSYDLITNVDANRYASCEDSLHLRLCKLHDEGFIDYEHRYSRYISTNRVVDKLSTILGKVEYDCSYKEYNGYCKNTELLLMDWIIRHRGVTEYPEIPVFDNVIEIDVEEYERERILYVTKSNIFLPLRTLYANLNEFVTLERILDCNEYLLSIQDEVVNRRLFGEKQQNDVLVNIPCGVHEDGQVRNAEALMSGTLTPIFISELCIGCQKERLYHNDYLLSLKNQQEQTTTLIHLSDDSDGELKEEEPDDQVEELDDGELLDDDGNDEVTIEDDVDDEENYDY